MKKVLILLLFIFAFLPIKVCATGGFTVSPSNITIEEGGSKSFSISAYNTIGDVKISSSNTSVATVSGDWGTGQCSDGQNISGNIIVNANKEGTAVITIMVDDAATFDNEDLSGRLVGNVTVTVVAKPSQPAVVPKNNTNNNSNGNNKTSDVLAKSSNNRLKELSIDNYQLTKIDDNNYSVDVRYDMEKVNIKASCEDSKARVDGVGEHKINIGDNIIELIITAENGNQNKVNVSVNRKDSYYLEDLDYVIDDSKYDKIDIKISGDNLIKSSEIDKIKKSKKLYNFNYYDKNNLIYSWVINGKNIKKVDDFNTKVLFVSFNRATISKLSNYAEGLYISFESDYIPNGSRLKIYVGDNYSNGDKVNIYHYNEDDKKLEYSEVKYKVKDGYVEFNVVDGEYFISMSMIDGLDIAPTPSGGVTISLIFFLFSFTVFGLAVLIYFIRKRTIQNI